MVNLEVYNKISDTLSGGKAVYDKILNRNFTFSKLKGRQDMTKKFQNDYRADSLESWADVYVIFSVVIATGLIVLMFVTRTCLGSFSSSGECYHYNSPNYLYILWAVLAIFQGFFIRSLILAAARALNYLKGIFDNTNVD